MTATAILEHVLKFTLVMIAAMAFRRVYFTTPVLGDYRAEREAEAEQNDGSLRWAMAYAATCPFCVTLWAALVFGVAVWALPAAYWPHWIGRVPSWLVAAFAAGYLADVLSRGAQSDDKAALDQIARMRAELAAALAEEAEPAAADADADADADAAEGPARASAPPAHQA